MFGLGNLEKLGIYAIILVVIVTSIFGYLQWRDYKTEIAALKKFNAAQIEETVKANEEFKQAMKSLSITLDRVTKTLDDANKLIDETAKNIETEVDDLKLPDADQPAPRHTQETIKRLKKFN